MTAMIQSDDALVEAIVSGFNGGLVDVPDPANARGFTTKYDPIEAMRRAILPILTARIASARAEGRRAGIEEAASYIDDHDPAFAACIRALAEKQP